MKKILSWSKLKEQAGAAAPSLDQSNWYVHGKLGTGKTRFAASIPDALLLDFEGGSTLIPAKECRAERLVIPKKGGKRFFTDVLAQLVSDAECGKWQYRRVVIDSLDRWYHLEAAHYVEMRNESAAVPVPTFADLPDDETAYGKAAGRLNGAMDAILGLLNTAGYGWLVVGHLMYQEVLDKGKTVIRPNPLVPGKTPGAIQSQAHFVAEILRAPYIPDSMEELAKGVDTGVAHTLSFKVTGTNTEAKARLDTMKNKAYRIPKVDAWTEVVAPLYESGLKSEGLL